MQEELLFQVALTMIPQIGNAIGRELLEHVGAASDIFKLSRRKLELIPSVGPIRAQIIKSFQDFERVEQELKFIEKYNVQTLWLQDAAYPQKLSHCNDAPLMLYFKGNADLNRERIISIVGTRHPSAYGLQLCRDLVTDLNDKNIMIISGLAYGIDIAAHRTCLKTGIPTIGVLGHGLDRIYPQIHLPEAREMLQHGGLLTDFPSRTEPGRQHFPRRNRIVAGLSSATIVIESGEKGGSMITARLAFDYNRDVFAFPGRVSDPASRGCLQLVQSQKAALVKNAQDILEALGWEDNRLRTYTPQRSIFPSLGNDEVIIFNLLQNHKILHIDDITRESGFNTGKANGILLGLELQSVIRTLPGKMYELL